MLLLGVLILGLGTVLALSDANGYNGYKIFEVVPKTSKQADFLYQLSKNQDLYDFFSLSKLPNHITRVMVNPIGEENFIKSLTQHALTHKVINENVGQTIEQEFQLSRKKRDLKPFSGKGRLSTDRYYTHDEINNYIEDLAQHFPARVFVKLVGKSYERRNIKTVTITNGDGRANKNVIFIDGGSHAQEWMSPAAALYLIEQLAENFVENSDLLLNYDWVILPVVNPDGYEYTQINTNNRFWRKTRKPYGPICSGTNTNRNFGFHWNAEGLSANPCWDYYAGPNAFSEPETIIVRDIMHSLVDRGIMYLTIHTFGSYLLYPWGWTDELPDTWTDLDEVARAGGDAMYEATGNPYTVGSASNISDIAFGASDDYALSIGFPISITMELTGGGITGYDPPASRIDEFVKESWIGIRAMAKKVIAKYPAN